MLVHGLIDENVHFRHAARLINTLIEHRVEHELVLFPCERHVPHKLQDRIYLEDRILSFLERSLTASTHQQQQQQQQQQEEDAVVRVPMQVALQSHL